jgi:hypothetical protein
MPYTAFYVVLERDVAAVAVEYASRDYVSRVTKRVEGAR